MKYFFVTRMKNSEQTFGGTEFEVGLKWKIHFSQSFASDPLQEISPEW